MYEYWMENRSAKERSDFRVYSKVAAPGVGKAGLLLDVNGHF